MISENMQALFNTQAKAEADASSVYLSMAAWCESNGFVGSAKYFFKAATDERDHMLAFLRYVIDQNGVARVPAVAEPPHEWNGLPQICQQVLELEMAVAAKIHKIVDLAIAENDHATHNWLEAFVVEQREAEVKARQTLDMIKVVGVAGTGLYEIDKNIGKMAEG